MVDLQTPSPPSPVLPPRRRFGFAAVALVVVIVVALAATVILIATDDDRSGPAPSGTTAPPASSPTTVDPQATTKAAIIAAYRQSFDAFVAVGSDPNGQPTDPRLEEHTIGNALLASQVSIDRLRKAGHVYQGTIELHPVVVELRGETAVIEDCNIDRLSVVNAATGEVVTPADPEPSGTLARAMYKLINGVWMQDGFKDLKQPCVPAS